jgi:hypothetical protein
MALVHGAVLPVQVRMEILPVSGDTLTIRAPYNHLLITKGTTTAALTVVLPASPADGDMVHISSVAAVTALTMSPVVTGGPSAMVAGVGFSVFWSDLGQVWYQY